MGIPHGFKQFDDGLFKGIFGKDGGHGGSPLFYIEKKLFNNIFTSSTRAPPKAERQITKKAYSSKLLLFTSSLQNIQVKL